MRTNRHWDYRSDKGTMAVCLLLFNDVVINKKYDFHTGNHSNKWERAIEDKCPSCINYYYRLSSGHCRSVNYETRAHAHKETLNEEKEERNNNDV